MFASSYQSLPRFCRSRIGSATTPGFVDVLVGEERSASQTSDLLDQSQARNRRYLEVANPYRTELTNKDFSLCGQLFQNGVRSEFLY